MCDFKFLDFTPEEIIRIMQGDVKRFQRKYDYHTGLAKNYQLQIEELEIKIGKLRQKLQKESKD